MSEAKAKRSFNPVAERGMIAHEVRRSMTEDARVRLHRAMQAGDVAPRTFDGLVTGVLNTHEPQLAPEKGGSTLIAVLDSGVQVPVEQITKITKAPDA